MQLYLHLINTFGLYAVFLGVGAEGAGIPLPGESILIAASVYAGVTNNIPIGIVIVIATIGAVCGDSVGYFLGRKYGTYVLQQLGKFIFLSHDRLEKAQVIFHKYGHLIVFFGRFISIFRMFSPLLSGSNKYPYRFFILADFLGAVLWVSIYAILGYILGKNLPLLLSLVKSFSIVSLVIFILVVLFIICFFVYRRCRVQK